MENMPLPTVTEHSVRGQLEEELALPAAPWEPRWTNSIAFCLAVKNENVTDLREWLRYHRCAKASCALNMLSS